MCFLPLFFLSSLAPQQLDWLALYHHCIYIYLAFSCGHFACFLPLSTSDFLCSLYLPFNLFLVFDKIRDGYSLSSKNLKHGFCFPLLIMFGQKFAQIPSFDVHHIMRIYLSRFMHVVYVTAIQVLVLGNSFNDITDQDWALWTSMMHAL